MNILITVNNQNGQPIDIEIEETVYSSDSGNEYQYSGNNEIEKDEKYEIEGWRNKNEPFVASDSIKKSDNIASTNDDIANQINAQL